MWLLAIALLIALPIGGLVALFGVGLILSKVVEELPVTEEERAIVLTAEELAELGAGLEPQPHLGKLTKGKLRDGSYEVRYEYDASDSGGLFLDSSVSVDDDLDSTIGAYAGMDVAGRAGFALMLGGEGKTVRRDDLIRWGEQSRHELLQDNQGQPAGNFFIARQGTKIFNVSFVGVGFDDRESIEALLLPKLERLEGYRP
ncbi:MAG: hypothetical protein HYZ28_06600 [Myxococcales bacterium]|nr:hypothetical protein [Myxococcales bacterium]